MNFRERRAEQGAKFSSSREISEFLSDCEIPRGGGDIPTLFKQAISLDSSSSE